MVRLTIYALAVARRAMKPSAQHALHTKDRAYERLNAVSSSGELQPDPFLPERRLAAHFVMSVTPTRSAIKHLETDAYPPGRCRRSVRYAQSWPLSFPERGR